MKNRWGIAVAGLVLASTAGCYHAVIETGRAPSAQTVETPWAHSFLYGLVPPAETDASVCANGVARVETQHSFLNGLAAGLTFGIYTPMHITATCAQAGATGATGIPLRDLVQGPSDSAAAAAR